MAPSPPARPPRGQVFRSLRIYNYRLWAAGALVSNIGTWMQRTAQDWVVLTQLTAHNATAVGIVIALQFLPQVLCLPLTGYAADHFDRRRLLFATQGMQGLLALGLGLLSLAGVLTLWEVYAFAFLLGCANAFDAPVRQTFVAELVGEQDLSNAVALNSTSFNVARMIGPAVAGILMGAMGSGWVFMLNAASFGAVILSLLLLRRHELHRGADKPVRRGKLSDGFKYVWARPDLKTVLIMLFLIGTFAFHSPIFISTMTVTVFHAGAHEYGLLSSLMAVGAVVGALLSAHRERPTFGVLLTGVMVLAAGFVLAACMPTFWLFAAALIVIGIAGQTFTTSSLATVQLGTDRQMRGRVMAIVLAVALGGTPVGAPFVGWVADRFGPRWALWVGAIASTIAVAVALSHHRRDPPEAPAPVVGAEAEAAPDLG